MRSSRTPHRRRPRGTCASTRCAPTTSSTPSARTTGSRSRCGTSTVFPSPTSPSCSVARPAPPRRCSCAPGRRTAASTWKEREGGMSDPFEALRRTPDAVPPRPAFVAELADRLRVELGIREGDEATVMMRTMGDMPVPGGVPNALVDVIEDQGYAVLENALTPDDVSRVRDALAPYLGDGPFGRNDFEGF